MVTEAALDTSQGVALAVRRDGRLPVRAAEALSGRDSDSRLALWIEERLAAAGLTLADIGRWTVGTGPGSFSGLRAGIAFIQGVAAAGGAPLRGLPSSLALARDAWAAAAAGGDAAGEVAVLHDARQRQVLVSVWRHAAGGAWSEAQPARVAEPAEAARVVAACRLAVTGHLERLAALLPAETVAKLLAREQVAAEFLLDVPGQPWPAADEAAAESCQPVYVRPAVFVPPAPIRGLVQPEH